MPNLHKKSGMVSTKEALWILQNPFNGFARNKHEPQIKQTNNLTRKLTLS